MVAATVDDARPLVSVRRTRTRMVTGGACQSTPTSHRRAPVPDTRTARTDPGAMGGFGESCLGDLLDEVRSTSAVKRAC